MKSFDIPTFYRSSIIGRIKNLRKRTDPRKKDFTPTVLDLGTVRFLLARHFGFCYGVENAIEISYRCLNENPGKQIYLLSQMIHNPAVNADLQDRGIRFLQDTYGNPLIDIDTLNEDEIVIVPAFGTTLEMEAKLKEKGIAVEAYNTTCPFVEKVWKRSSKLGSEDCTIIIHGKPKHEETRATFSHASENTPAVVVKDMQQSERLAYFIQNPAKQNEFEAEFAGQFSEGFNLEKDLLKVGVVNQTTMLASETQAIADYFKQVMTEKYGVEAIKQHFADTRDTLCYATNDNQQATYGLLEFGADTAFVVGGFNSSNTTHLVELMEEQMPTWFIQSEEDILSEEQIRHFDIHAKEVKESNSYLPQTDEVPTIVVTSGASCPDAVVDRVIQRILTFYPGHKDVQSAIDHLEKEMV